MFTVAMNFERSTKHTHVYQAEKPDDRIKTLYITQDGKSPPSRIIITVQDGSSHV